MASYNFDSDEIIRDEEHRRLLQCDACGKVAAEDYFIFYGGKGHVNRGICRICSENGRWRDLRRKRGMKW